ncbi:MAG TPA: HAD family hydrolase [bacterium]|nr:HAD family hydrolase [bacterium]
MENSNNNYKVLLVDLDDTLIMSGKVYNEALRYASKFLSSRYDLKEEDFFNLAKEKYDVIARNFPSVHTRHSRILLFRMALDEVLPDSYDLGILPDIEDMYWEFFMKNVKCFPYVKSTLAKLRRNGIKIAVVSDGDLALRIRKARSSGLLKYLNEIVASEEVIFEKPFSAIFTLALSRLGVEPHQAVMLGNNYKNDVRGAQLVDIKAGIFLPEKNANPVGQDGTIKPDFVIKRFDEVLKIFGLDESSSSK